MSGGTTERGARRGRETTWLFLRTLVGLLAAAWLLPALFLPPDPLPFLVSTAVLWLAATVAAWWLVYLDGFAWLDGQSWYRPGLAPARALALFVGVALALKVGGTLLVDQYVSGLPGYAFVEPQVAPGGGAVEATETANGTATATATETAANGTAAPAQASGDVTAVRDRPYVYDLAVSTVALVAAYLAVFRGFAAWLLEADDG